MQWWLKQEASFGLVAVHLIVIYERGYMKYKLIIMAIFFTGYASYMAYFCYETNVTAKEEAQEIYEDKFCIRYPNCTMPHLEDSDFCAAHKAEREQSDYDYWHANPKELEAQAAEIRKNGPGVEWREEQADDLEKRAAIIRKNYSRYYSSNKTKKKHISAGKTKTNRLDYDPDDYDTPEDYADDAVGNDFEEWEDAYEYWEEVE